MKYRKLRITFSAVCGLMCLLLIALWVRSYSWMDEAGHVYNNAKSLILFFQTEPGSLNATWQDANGFSYSEEYYSGIFKTQPQNLSPGCVAS